jgi:hypothetical protein
MEELIRARLSLVGLSYYVSDSGSSSIDRSFIGVPIVE